MNSDIRAVRWITLIAVFTMAAAVWSAAMAYSINREPGRGDEVRAPSEIRMETQRHAGKSALLQIFTGTLMIVRKSVREDFPKRKATPTVIDDAFTVLGAIGFALVAVVFVYYAATGQLGEPRDY